MKERKVILPLRLDKLAKLFKTQPTMLPDCRRWMAGVRLSEDRLPERVRRTVPMASGVVFGRRWRPIHPKAFRNCYALFPDGQLWRRNCLALHARLEKNKKADKLSWPPEDRGVVRFTKNGRRWRFKPLSR